jgi:protein AATF/BFR2
MKFKQKKTSKISLSDKIADALTVKPRADIEDDEVFGTKPHTVSRAEFSSSDSEDETTISDFRKQNVNLLSEISKKYEGKVVSRKDLDKELEDDSDTDVSESDEKNSKEGSSDENDTSEAIKKFKELTKLDDSDESQDTDDEDSEEEINTKTLKRKAKSNLDLNSGDSEESDDGDGESDDYSITQFKKQLEKDDESAEGSDDDDADDDEGEGFDVSQMEEPLKEEFKHIKKQNVSEEAKKGACVRNQLQLWEGLLEMRIHLQRCMNTANQMPMPDTHQELQQNNQFTEECNTAKTNIATVLDK